MTAPLLSQKKKMVLRGPCTCLSLVIGEAPKFLWIEIGFPLNLSILGTFLTSLLIVEFVLSGFRRPLMCPAFVQYPQNRHYCSPQELLFYPLQSQS